MGMVRGSQREWSRLSLTGLRRALGDWAGNLPGRYLLVIDFLGVAAAAYLALALRYDRFNVVALVPSAAIIIALVIAVRFLIDVRFGLYNRRWKHASIPELERIAVAVWFGMLASAAVIYTLALTVDSSLVVGLPRSFWVIEPLLSGLAIGGVRLTIRASSEARPGARALPATSRALLYGAGETGSFMARSARRHPGSGVVPVGFLDDDPSLVGEIVAGLRVYGGLGRMAEAIKATSARTLLITMPSAPGTAVRRVFDAAAALGLEVRTVPSMSDLLDGTVDAYRIRPVCVQDLLRRPAITERDSDLAEEIIRDKVVVITGGGGSIGSELARQVFGMKPRRLVLIDRAESPLYMIQRELEARRDKGHLDSELRVHLANVASSAAMRRIIAEEQPSVIFHAAAYKHVPMMQTHPSDAAYVNVRGTLSLLNAAVEQGVERFVLVSTDKAVRPTSVMGATKRIAEMLVADAARRTGRAYVSVRFGNVLGSTGSVVPIFQQQLEAGRPLTITDPEMTRFFMTIPEACRLILDAAALGKQGDLFVLDMGEPVKVLDLARDLVRLSGRDPESQPFEIVGLRPGEKLHEELFYASEEVEPTGAPKVLRAISAPPPADVLDHVAAILQMATGEREPELAAAILGYARLSDGVGSTVAPGYEEIEDDEEQPNLLGSTAAAIGRLSLDPPTLGIPVMGTEQ
jgi:FlaA1/EpsC-like NDP-sugar epimerase